MIWDRRWIALLVATLCFVVAWAGTATLVFQTRDVAHLIALALWTWNVTYYARWTYSSYESSKAKKAKKDEPHYTCPFCGAVSYNENDIEHGYCGRCHEYSK